MPEVVIVGAGAAGLLAGIRAAERGRRTLLIEKNRKPGAKILMSGGTRCNLTHATGPRGIVEAFGKQGRFLHSALAALGPSDLVELIENEGVATKTEESGKIFPASDRAADVLNGLLRRLRRSGCEVATDEPLINLLAPAGGDPSSNGQFQLVTKRRSLAAERVIVTCGGRSYPGCGTTGDGYQWMKDLGHTITPLFPALTPITSDAEWVRSLQGLAIQKAAVRLIDIETGKPHRLQATGAILFTHFGLSGPAILNVSRLVSQSATPREFELECDLLPDRDESALADELQQRGREDGKKIVPSLLIDHLPRRLADQLCELSAIPLDQRAAELSKQQRQTLVRHVKRLRIPVSGTRGYKKAEVTTGGVSLAEVHSKTMESKIVPGLFLAGEILDLDGPIGGYNFQAAFSTGWLAASHA